MPATTLEPPRGDHPARSRYDFTDTGSQERQAVLIASQSRTYDPAATAALAYEAEDLTPLDTAAIATKSGAHGGGSNNVVEHDAIGAQWSPILSTEDSTNGQLTHTGSYRLYARVYADNESLVRLEYSAGDGNVRRVNRTKTIPGSDTFYIVDLGEVRIDQARVGTQQWQGGIFAYSETAATTVGIDKLWLAPTESICVVKARKEPSNSIAVPFGGYDAQDLFNQTAGNLSGKTADVGGNWTTYGGDATDFTVTGSGTAQRTEVSDAALAGRAAVLGSASAAQVVRADVSFSGDPAVPDFAPRRFGVVARHIGTNVSNFVSAYLYRADVDEPAYFVLAVRIGGANESVKLTQSSYLGLSGIEYTIRLAVWPDGVAQAWLTFGGVGFSPQPALTLESSRLATGGTLASGKAGLYDELGDTDPITRTYDNFLAYTPESDAACLADSTMSARFDGAFRETATSGIYAPAHVEGQLPRAPASGLEGRTCRTIVLPSTGDFEALPDADPTGFDVESYHAPSYLFVPEG